MKTATFGVSLTAALLSLAAVAGPNDGTGAKDAPAGSLPGNHGQVLCTAAINSDGTVAGGQHVKLAGTSRLGGAGVGNYQVEFFAPCTNIVASRGWARWVQADTLATGTTIGYCTTADRAGNINAVFVTCRDAAGVALDTSFFLFVAR